MPAALKAAAFEKRARAAHGVKARMKKVFDKTVKAVLYFIQRFISGGYNYAAYSDSGR